MHTGHSTVVVIELLWILFLIRKTIWIVILLQLTFGSFNAKRSFLPTTTTTLRSFESCGLSPWFFASIQFIFIFVYLFLLSLISSLCGQIPSGHRNLSERVC